MLLKQGGRNADLLVVVSAVHQRGAREAVVPCRGHGQAMAAHQRAGDQLDDLKVLLQVLDDALMRGRRERVER